MKIGVAHAAQRHQQRVAQRHLRAGKAEPEMDGSEVLETGAPRETLNLVSRTVSVVPQGFTINPKMVSQMSRRAKMGSGEIPIDWGFAEGLAFGSLVLEGSSVRLSGQDSGRGTFSQRHAVMYDTRTGNPWTGLEALAKNGARFEVFDSSLSEAAVLGYEYGYSVIALKDLTIWEAQFGDFANGAQVIIDQFIAPSEDKWKQLSRLALLLPHGYEGQGPEHSSARLERYLQLCAEDNMQVCYPTTPAQYFHLLRRQVKQELMKPLIVMTPKSLLRLPRGGFFAGSIRERRLPACHRRCGQSGGRRTRACCAAARFITICWRSLRKTRPTASRFCGWNSSIRSR